MTLDFTSTPARARTGSSLRKFSAAFLFFLSIFLVSSCTRSPLDSGSIIAKVNGEAVMADEFHQNFRQLLVDYDNISKENPRILKQLKLRALNECVIMTLLRQEGAKRNLRIAPAEVESRLANWKDSFPSGTFEKMLKEQNRSEEFLKKRIADQILIERILEEFFAGETLVSDEEMKNYYAKHQNEFFRPVRAHVLQILVPTREEAEKIRAEISTEQVTFESAARKYSLSPDAAKGGDLGFFAKNEKIAAFNVAFNLSTGQISQPIQSSFGFHLLKVIDKEPSKKLAFLEAREEIQKVLKKSKEVLVYKDWLVKLLKDSEIYQNDVVFESIS